MGREIYTYKLDQEKISNNLIKLMLNETQIPINFKDYISQEVNPKRVDYNRKNKTEFYQPFDVNSIIQNLKELENLAIVSDVALTFEWLFLLFDFGYRTDEETNEILEHYGFIEILEIGQKDSCWVYGNQLSEYENMNDLEPYISTYDGCFHLYNSDFYKNYLAYLLVLLSKICLDKDYKNNDDNYTIEELTFLKTYNTNELIEQQTEKALNIIRIENQEEDENEEANFRRSATASHYLVAFHMFHQIKEVQQRIINYHGKIFIFDSF